MSLNDAMIDLIDQRVRAARVTDRATGTIVTRSTATYDGTVLFDGATVATPVKIIPSTNTRDGDRVLLDRYGSDWLVTESWGGLGLGEAVTYVYSDSGAETDAGYSDFPGSPSAQIGKSYDATAVRITLACSMWASNSVNTSVDTAMRIAGVAGTSTEGFSAYDEFMQHFHFNQVDVHLPVIGGPKWAIGLPAGLYTFTPRWRRAAGAGNLNMDGNDVAHIECMEIWRAH